MSLDSPATDRRPDPGGHGPSRSAFQKAEHGLEVVLFGSRWILAPFYLGLAVALLVLLYKFVLAVAHLIHVAVTRNFEATTIAVLELLDITLIANLVLIVVFAGYESFVSKMEQARGSVDRPDWMGKVDFSALKMKVIGSIVAISAIGLLQDFMGEGGRMDDDRTLQWRVAIHVTFLLSGVLFAFMDLLAEKRRVVEVAADKALIELDEAHPEHKES